MIVVAAAAAAEEIVMGAAHAMPHATAEADTGHSGQLAGRALDAPYSSHTHTHTVISS